MKTIKKLFISAMLLGLSTQANAIAIDFDTGTVGADVGAAYAALGVTFSNTSFVDNFGFAGTTSPLGIAGRGGPWTYAFGQSNAIIADFAFGVTTISIMGFDVGSGGARIDAFDINGVLIDFDEAFGTGIGVGQSFTLTSGASAIYSIAMYQVYEGDGGDGMLFDNFSFERASVPESATLVLMGLGLIGMGALRRRKSA